jgi:hypothetical protein
MESEEKVSTPKQVEEQKQSGKNKGSKNNKNSKLVAPIFADKEIVVQS